METILNILINNGIGAACAALVVWMMWYRETKTMPNLIKAFNDAHATQQMAEDTRNSKNLDTFATLVREERAVYQRWHEDNRSRLDQIILDQKEHRHYTRNLAHQLGLRQATDEETQREKPPKE